MRLMIAVGGLLIALSGGAMAAQVYKWVDAQGVTHFGTEPPANQAVTRINTKSSTGQTENSAAATAPSEDPQQKAADEKVRKEVASRTEEIKQYCGKLRDHLAQLKNNPRLRVEEKGEVRRIGEDERQAQITETEKRIADDCR